MLLSVTMSEGFPYQFWVDRGGTFTDCILTDLRRGETRTKKVLSSERAPVEGLRDLLGLSPDQSPPPCDIRMGTTLATNALLERKGTNCALVVTRGFADLLEIGDQTRPELFALAIKKSRPVTQEIIEVGVRRNAEAQIQIALNKAEIRSKLNDVFKSGVRSLAVALVHAYLDGSDEECIRDIAFELGFEHVTMSHEISKEMGYLARAQTSVVDAYLTPLIRNYIQELEQELPGSSLRIMQSDGGLVDGARFRGRDAILSGPAGGAVAVAHICDRLKEVSAIGFDMGGTSTDVSRFDGEHHRVFESDIDGIRIRAPMLDINTVAAGGGSICRVDGGRLVVGPQSAGAKPGPLCYGDPRAEQVALTDAALVLGRVVPDRFPIQLDVERARTGLRRIRTELSGYGYDWSLEEIAEGFIKIAVDNMANAIRKVSIAKGHDVRADAMVVFGGAGGQYACRVARELSIKKLIFHPYASLMSAYGIGVAPVVWQGEHALNTKHFDRATLCTWRRIAEEMHALAREELPSQDLARAGELRVTHQVALRYQGTETALPVELGELSEMLEYFEHLHRMEFGYVREGHPLEATVVRTRMELYASEPEVRSDSQGAKLRDSTSLWIDGAYRDVPLLERDELQEGQTLKAPCVIVDDTHAIIVEAGFVARVKEAGFIVLEEQERTATKSGLESKKDPVLIEIFNNRFMSIAEQMGAVLQRTAFSTNIRDRLDFSCALFNARGELIANAPHIPVHLGAMGESVRAVISAHPEMQSGDVFATNDPHAGGSHLPDITVVSPVYDDSGQRRFFVASRGHHADIGGLTPGSMPSSSTCIEEEGVVLRCMRVVHQDRFLEQDLRSVLSTGPYPARAPEENIADVVAQIAANNQGIGLLGELIEDYGVDIVESYMDHVLELADTLVREALLRFDQETYAFEDSLDDGAKICVELRREGSFFVFDFEGTSDAVSGNLNAPKAVTIAAVLYVLRTLVERPIPLNQGCLRSVQIRIPPHSILNPPPGVAVVAGNVETSQRVVDVLYGALGVVAASQGTMNNLAFGDDSSAYYETIAGGAGAGPGFAGASGVHTHMTNSRITDVEILESRYPVQVRLFGIRQHSGGRGQFSGGNGLVRELEFLRPMQVSVISERRTTCPYALSGGEPGKSGRNFLNGQALAAKFSLSVEAGDVLRIETPGGGAWGSP